MTTPITPGTIIQATVPDPRGANVKPRPLVVLRAATEGEPTVIAVAITSLPPTKAEEPFYVKLPYQRDGKGGTRLNRESWAVVYWVASLLPHEVEAVTGCVPSRHLIRISDALKAAGGPGSPEPPAG